MKTSFKTIELHAYKIMKRAQGLSESSLSRKFKALFRVSVKMVCILWNILPNQISRRASLKHLMWTLLFMKSYCNEHILSSLVYGDEKATTQQCRTFVEAIANLEMVSSLVSCNSLRLTGSR